MYMFVYSVLIPACHVQLASFVIKVQHKGGSLYKQYEGTNPIVTAKHCAVKLSANDLMADSLLCISAVASGVVANTAGVFSVPLGVDVLLPGLVGSDRS